MEEKQGRQFGVSLILKEGQIKPPDGTDFELNYNHYVYYLCIEKIQNVIPTYQLQLVCT